MIYPNILLGTFFQTCWILVLSFELETQLIICIKQYIKLVLNKSIMYLYSLKRYFFCSKLLYGALPWVVGSVTLHALQWHTADSSVWLAVSSLICNLKYKCRTCASKCAYKLLQQNCCQWYFILPVFCEWISHIREQFGHRHCWLNHVRDGHMDAANMPCRIQSRTISMECNNDDWTEAVTNIVAQLGIWQNGVHDITSTLGNQDVCCNWAPHLLKNEAKGHV